MTRSPLSRLDFPDGTLYALHPKESNNQEENLVFDSNEKRAFFSGYIRNPRLKDYIVKILQDAEGIKATSLNGLVYQIDIEKFTLQRIGYTK